MAKAGVIAVLTLALGAVTLWGPSMVFQAFVPTMGPSGSTPGDRFLGVAGAPSEGLASTTFNTAGVATAAVSLVAALAAGRLLAARGQRRAAAPVVVCRAAAEEVFAGGLIGGESAFSSGDYNFDPLKFSTRWPGWMPWAREAELKHGRICMLAWLGLVVPDFVRIPVPERCASAANAVEAHTKCIPQYGEGVVTPDLTAPLGQVFFWCAIVELCTTLPKAQQGITLENAGDYRLGLNFLPKDEAKAKEMKLKELKNGRLAMVAFGGAVTQAVLSGNGFPWMYAQRRQGAATGLSSSVPAVAAPPAKRGAAPRAAMQAEGGFKMSKSVPFLPVSPALEGYVGEEDGFDPMGVSLAIDIRWLREAELKHGRVAMLATLGWITTDLGVRVPGPMFQVSTLQAHDAMVDFSSMSQMLVWIGYAELFGFLAIINMMEYKTDRKPGDFGIRGLYPADEKGQYDMQLKELRNGRLAMLAYSGIVTSAVLTGGTWPFFATSVESKSTAAFGEGSTFCGARPGAARGAVATRALEASKSLPFMPKPQKLAGWVGEEQEFDPLGFSDTFDMNWMREAELKHGRITMLACVGFYAQQYITFPGLTPTPNALESVGAAPAGFGLLIAAAGWIESASYDGKITMLDMFEDGRTPGDFAFGSGFLKGKSEAEIKELKLKEINNGRLAMMAFGGMIHHNLVCKGPLFPMFPEGWAGPQYTWSEENTGFITELVRGRAGWNGTFENAPKGFYPQGPNQWTPESPPDMVVELNLGGEIGQSLDWFPAPFVPP